MGLKDTVKRCVSNGLFYTGLLDLVGWCKRRRVTVLTFHCLSAPDQPYFRDGMKLESSEFREVIEGLKRRYRIVSLDQAARELTTKVEGKPAAVLTFDDGYRNVYDLAFPILKETGVTATVFLPTDYIGTGRMLWWDEVRHLAGPERADAEVNRLRVLSAVQREPELERMREEAGDKPPPERLMMTWDEVREMAEAGIDFGAHTVSHCYLDLQTPERLRIELEQSRDIIRERIGRAPTAFSYPDGRYNDAVLAATRAAGYEHAVTTVAGSNRPPCDPFTIARFDGSLSFTAGGDHVSFPVMWSELLGVWDLLFLRYWREPARFSPERPSA